jgi:hypothetical protein
MFRPFVKRALMAGLAFGMFDAGGCGGGREEMRLVEETACPVYDDSTAALPRLLYEDGTRTLNDRCMVRSAKLNPKIRAIFVNGRPVGFC